MSYYSDPTASRAIGNIDREINAKRRLAARLSRRARRSPLTPQELADARRQFPGIYRRILENALAASAASEKG